MQVPNVSAISGPIMGDTSIDATNEMTLLSSNPIDAIQQANTTYMQKSNVIDALAFTFDTTWATVRRAVIDFRNLFCCCLNWVSDRWTGSPFP